MNDAIGAITLAATYSWTDDFIYDRNGGPRGIIPSFGLLNLNANWRSVGGSPVDLSLFATNVTGKKYFNTVFDQRDSAGFMSQIYGEPRIHGVRLRYNFGS